MPGGTPDKIRNTSQAGQPRLNGKLSNRHYLESPPDQVTLITLPFDPAPKS
jgi:hypothetical protein